MQLRHVLIAADHARRAIRNGDPEAAARWCKVFAQTASLAQRVARVKSQQELRREGAG